MAIAPPQLPSPPADGPPARVDATAGPVARAALSPADRRVAIELRDDGRVTGRAAYELVYGPRAVLTLDVDEEQCRRGVPQQLIETISASAVLLGVTTFLMRVPASDICLLALLREHFRARETRDGGHVDVEFATDPARTEHY